VPPGGPPRIPSRRFAPTPDTVATLRGIVAGHLDHAPSACRAAVVSIASELATNAVLHARTPYVVELHLTDVVRIEVTDAAPGAPVMRLVPQDAESGRGLFMVSKLAGRWGVDWLDDCKVVWAEVPLDVGD
jgi:anti-sigma regulatory factor (Ser/Thr protein kinase)